MTGRSTSSVPLGAAVSEHMREQPGAGDEPGARSRVSTSKEPSRPASEWVDVEEDRPRRRRRSRQPVYEDSKTDRLGKTKHSSSVNADIGRFLPKLSHILESADTNSRNTQSIYGSRPSNRDIEEKSRTSRHRESSDSNYRHAVRRKVTGAQRRSEPVPRINPSLVSLLSSLTTISDRSSGSNSTITQRSYDRQRGVAPRTDTGGSGKIRTAKRSNLSTMSRSKSPNVFDYMEDPSVVDEHVVDEHDDKSAKSPASSVSSRYQGSDAGSSEGPATPSSRSTMPSPTTSRDPGVSVAELRRKYDQDFNGATTRPVGGSPGMVSSTLSAQKERYSNVASDQRSDNGSIASPSMASSVPELGASRRRSSHTSLRALDAEQRLKQREQEMREHMAFTQHPYAYEFTSPPEASDHDDPQARDPATPATHQAVQHYIHHPVPTRPIPAKVVRSTPSPSCTTHPPAPNPPHVPEAPDFSKTTLAGYELLATHLAPPVSTSTTTEPYLTPLYRKFSHLHHRILLHLQDELAEMESQLRVLDEIVAQTYTSPAPQSTTEHPEKHSQPQPQPQHHPASRRAESHPHNPPIFAHRTALLGRIFLKKQQYHAALRDFAALKRDSRPAEAGEIEKYRAFLKARAPVCEGEAEFLARGDLVVPLAVAGAGAGTGRRERERERERDGVLWEQAAFLAALLVLPLVISVALPGLGARVAATGLLGAGAGLVVWGARVRGRG